MRIFQKGRGTCPSIAMMPSNTVLQPQQASLFTVLVQSLYDQEALLRNGSIIWTLSAEHYTKHCADI